MAIGDQIKQVVSRPLEAAWDGVARWVDVERALAIALVASPLIMAVFDWTTSDRPFGFRASISDYYTMKDPAMGAQPAFYVPLTVAAMLFFVNGVIREGHGFNAFFGVLLAMVVIFNKDGFGWVHFPAAGGFYLGNAYMVWRSKDPEGSRKKLILGLGGGVLAYWAVFGSTVSTALFWAEWFGLALIGIHFVFDASEPTAYQAPRSEGEPDKPAVVKAEAEARQARSRNKSK